MLINIKDKRLYEYLFKLRGGKSRLKILTLLTSPRTRQDIAKELKMDWKEVDRNLSILMTLNLVTVAYSSPKIKVYTLTDYGKSILSKISEEKLH
jgi:predicted transcriptional regulator